MLEPGGSCRPIRDHLDPQSARMQQTRRPNGVGVRGRGGARHPEHATSCLPASAPTDRAAPRSPACPCEASVLAQPVRPFMGWRRAEEHLGGGVLPKGVQALRRTAQRPSCLPVLAKRGCWRSRCAPLWGVECALQGVLACQSSQREGAGAASLRPSGCTKRVSSRTEGPRQAGGVSGWATGSPIRPSAPFRSPGRSQQIPTRITGAPSARWVSPIKSHAPASSRSVFVCRLVFIGGLSPKHVTFMRGQTTPVRCTVLPRARGAPCPPARAPAAGLGRPFPNTHRSHGRTGETHGHNTTAASAVNTGAAPCAVRPTLQRR